MHGFPCTMEAIVARSLTMNLAYPQIQESLVELLGSTGPEFGFIAPSAFGIDGKNMAIGTLQHMFGQVYKVSAL